ncbi:ankyrin repeat domain-containing protein [Phytopseudomonas dryadis]|uniref:Uncharacterized protein n=1 Tax=Phytopseudomonas dryadis TaxID=2487520 RepID=A0A4Q9QWT4_9GAMM|nr:MULTISPECIES: ankyrin repeat domain-containing protein [Pseudomonas]TBU88648.1 hypothetical protein DNK44_18110 [Pseudomonas dryadis]TBV01666.1 hypothetical protein DNK34_20630 [Pseudomonas dryadis]TBV14173.1 hypothetical protein DNK41_20505 [Pseudomonas sp. FRB 230]
MIKRIGLGLITLAVIVFLSAAIHSMTNYRVQQLILCSEPGNGFFVPAPICRQYLITFRMGPDDIQQLQADGGIAFVLESELPQRFELAERFLAHGLDVNADIRSALGERTHTPLHSAAILNQPENLGFLLLHGADRSKLNSEGETPLQVAERLQSQYPGEDRSVIIGTLRSAVDVATP